LVEVAVHQLLPVKREELEALVILTEVMAEVEMVLMVEVVLVRVEMVLTRVLIVWVQMELLPVLLL